MGYFIVGVVSALVVAVAWGVKFYLQMRSMLAYSEDARMNLSMQISRDQKIFRERVAELIDESREYRRAASDASYEASRVRLENAVLRERLDMCFAWLEQNRKPRCGGEVSVLREGE